MEFSLIKQNYSFIIFINQSFLHTMRKVLLWMLAIIALMVISPTDVCAAKAVEATRGVVRVKLQPEVARTVAKAPRLRTSSGKVSSGVESLDHALNLISGVNIKPMLAPNPKFAAQRAKYGLDQWYVVTFDERLAPESIKKDLQEVAGIMTAEVVKPMSLIEGDGGFRIAKSMSARAASNNYPFNDPRLPDQWHYKNFGDKAQRVEGADINLFDAWKITSGKNDVIVAIIDGGVDYSHEDLKDNMFINEAELYGTPGVDDDGNGFIDDVYGYNFCTDSPDVYPHEHGTHVAGTVAAVNNNGIGVAGVAGGDGTEGSGAKLISCQVFDSRQGAGEGDFAKAIIYACERGATIAQCSWGWSEPGYCEQAVLDAIDYFTENAKNSKMMGGLMIFAAGNDGNTGDYYPACYPKVLAVASMASDLTPTSYSNYGDWVDVIAPGGLMDYSEADGVLSTLPNNQYGFFEGTSMATPHVSGIAALVLSEHGSATFTNEALRTQLVSSVKDFYSYGNNEQFRGQYGSGYIDAYKALLMGDGSAPEAVADFSLQASQDYILVDWVIPASNDNTVHSHIIYYSTEAFTAESDLSKVKSIIADTKFAYSGDKFTQKISSLTPLTKYYVAIKAVSRQGNASALSPIKEISTNEGPKMTLNVNSISINSNAANPIANGTFTIGNDADGILTWSVANKTVSMRPTELSRRPTNIIPGAMARNYTGKIAYIPNASKASGTVSDTYEATEYPKNLKYYETYYAVLGEEDKSIPNSMAQLFWVDPEKYPDGFNLTSIVVDYTYGKNPKIQIYKGPGPIATASLLQEVKYNYFTAKSPISLNEQIHFDANAAFWIVVHFEAGQESYPLPAAMYQNEYSYVNGYSFMSFDLGKTWLTLKAALAGSIYEQDADKLTWGISARSDNPDFNKVITLDPSSGTVAPHGSQEVKMSADGSKLINGTYKFNLQLSTNESNNEIVKFPVSYTVEGNTHNVQVPKVVDFGSLLVGQEKTLSVEVFNKGYGPFTGNKWYADLYQGNLSSSSDQFIQPSYVFGGIPARSRVSFDVTYKPTNAGSHTGNIILKDKDGKEVRVIVHGVATEPAKIELNPSIVEAGKLNVGDEAKEVKFKVVNAGNYPLEYVFPKFSDENVDGATARLHQFGYTVTANIDGYNTDFAYDNNTELSDATDVKSEFGDYSYLSSPVSMGFTFPYYGKNYDKIYITSFGALCFEPNTITLQSPLTPESGSLVGMGLISAYGRELQFGADSKVEYAKQDGKFIVKYTNVLGLVYGDATTPISFRIVLSSNGDIEIFYDKYNASKMFQEGCTLFCGINDPEMVDFLSITDANKAQYHPEWWGSDVVLTEENQRYTKFNDGTAVKFSAPKAMFVRSLDKPYGIINPNEDVEITASVKADENLDAGSTFNNLTIVTNDPNPAYSFVRFNAEIAGESLVPVAALEDNEISLGDLFRTSKVKTPVTVRNNGHDKLEVTKVEIEGAGLSVDESLTLPFTLEPRAAKDINIFVDTEKSGAISGTVKVSTSTGELSCVVKANIIGVPTIDLSFTEVNESLKSGAPLHKDLVVSNNGNEPLVYAITPDPIVGLTLPENKTAKVNYIYSYSEDDNDLTFAWEDVETNGLGVHSPMSYYNLHDYVEVELPFEFPFYGEKYSKMYIYNTGFVSFTKRNDDKIWPEPPAGFPSGTVYTNIIAPYWGLHSPNQTTTSGTYHYVTADRAVISWMEYGNSMNYDVCYQLIMEKNGTFKFQYKPNSNNGIIMAAYGIAGTSNADGSEGCRLPEHMIKFNTAVSFAPVTEVTLDAGKSETVGMDFVTRRMAGEYNANIKVSSNVPSKENISIPVTLNISGTPIITWPKDVEIEHPLGYYDLNDPAMNVWAAYSAQFTIQNTGTADFVIPMLEFESPMYEDPDFDDSYPMFQLYYYGEANSGIGGWEPLSEGGDRAWVPYNGEPMIVGKDGLKFMIPVFMESPAYNIPGEYNMKVKAYYGDEDAEEPEIKEINIKLTVTPMPVIYLDKEEITFTAKTDTDVMTESLIIGNAGEYKLSYDLVLDPTGVGEEPDYGIGGGEPDFGPLAVKEDVRKAFEGAELVKGQLAAKIETKDVATEWQNVYNVPTNFEFNDALYYPHIPNGTAYQYGANNVFDTYKAAVTFTAPKGGFNISHLYSAVSGYSAYNSDYNIRYSIVLGEDPDGKNVIGTAKLIPERQDDPMKGKYYVIPLDKPVYLSEGEVFTVVAAFDAGSPYPAFLSTMEEQVVPNRYQGWIESYGWFDVAELFKDQYGSIGYILSCLETVEGKPWVRILNAETSGSIEVEDFAEIKIEVNAASARLEKGNKAMLVIKSNDPQNSLINFPITLDCNSKPVIDAPTSKISTKENEAVDVKFSVVDPDSDDMIVNVVDNNGIAKITSYAVSEGDAAVVTKNEDGSYAISGANAPVEFTVTIAPEYGSACTGNILTITAVDSQNHSSEATVHYDIAFVNRAPEAVEIGEINVAVGSLSEVVTFASLFNDPDKEDLTFNFSMASNQFVDAYPNESGVVFYGKAKGTAKAIITATDTSGATAKNEVTVVVDDQSGINDINADGNGMLVVMPNPVEDVLNAKCGFSATNVVFSLYGINGTLVDRINSDVTEGDVVTMNVGGIQTGVYILTAEYEGATLVARVAKR